MFHLGAERPQAMDLESKVNTHEIFTRLLKQTIASPTDNTKSPSWRDSVMRKDMLMIDGLQYVNWNRELFEQAHKSGVNTIHVTIA